VITVDARVIIASLIDGMGLYLLINVLGYIGGLQSPRAADRIGGYVESTGLIREIFPLSRSLDIAPTIASVYLAAAVFLIFERGWVRRSFRLTCFAAAFVVLSQAGVRTALFTALVLPIVVICLPFIERWIAQATTLFAAVSALCLPAVVLSVQSVAIPLLSLIAHNRETHQGDITSLSARDTIWTGSVNFWINRIDGIGGRLLGFGQDGQYRSGASLTYARSLAGTVRHPEHASMHNSFLQQLFDGGLVGWFLLTFAIFWASARLARRRRDWGVQGAAAIVAMVAVLVNAMTQVSISPGAVHETFWLLMVLVGIACQAPKGSIAEEGTSGLGPDSQQMRETVEPVDRPPQLASLVASRRTSPVP
jgi:O-antigen ligase